jgi:hypothetical protein
MTKTIPMTLATLLFAAGSALATGQKPICGDVNNSNSINTSDALLVLKKGVGQPITLACTAYQDSIDTCQDALLSCQSSAGCGNGSLDSGEECETGDLGGATCAGEGFAGGTLACGSGCTFDTSGCYESRYDASGATIIDADTGLEWEKKESGDEVVDWENIHDADNRYSLCIPGAVYPSCLSPNNALDGTAISIVLAQLNGGNGQPCYAGHCDWRLPTIEELDGIFPEGPCDNQPCVADPAFLPAGSGGYWSFTTAGGATPTYAWGMIPDSLTPGKYYKRNELAVRAVRLRS